MKNLTFDKTINKSESTIQVPIEINELDLEILRNKQEKREYYISIVEDLKIEEMFDEVLDNIKKPNPNAIKMCEDLWNKEKKLGFKVSLAEIKIDGRPHHEIHEEVLIESEPLDFMNFFSFCDLADRKKFDNQVEAFDISYVLEHKGLQFMFIRQTTKKVMIIKGRELVLMRVGKILENGDWLFLIKSYDDKHFEKTKKWDRCYIPKSGIHFSTND